MTISTTTLKNAAFAIECDLWTDPATGANYLAKDGAILRRWEHEHDNGDALSLAVRLGIGIDIKPVTTRVCAYRHPDIMAVEVDEEMESATRKAIVCAASSIGEQLCQ